MIAARMRALLTHHGMDCLDIRNHLAKLEPDHRLLDQRLAEDMPLRRPLDAGLADHPGMPVPADYHLPSFDVEVAHRLVEALAWLTDQVFWRHNHLIKRDIGCRQVRAV